METEEGEGEAMRTDDAVPGIEQAPSPKRLDIRALWGRTTTWVTRHWRIVGGALALLLLLVVGLTALLREPVRDPLWLTYSGSYRLVPATLSQGP